MQKNNKVMDIDAKLKAVALSDNKLGLLQGKLGASIYFFVMSNHNDKTLLFTKTMTCFYLRLLNRDNA